MEVSGMSETAPRAHFSFTAHVLTLLSHRRFWSDSSEASLTEKGLV